MDKCDFEQLLTIISVCTDIEVKVSEDEETERLQAVKFVGLDGTEIAIHLLYEEDNIIFTSVNNGLLNKWDDFKINSSNGGVKGLIDEDGYLFLSIFRKGTEIGLLGLKARNED